MILAYRMRLGPTTVIGASLMDDNRSLVIQEGRAWLHEHLGDPACDPMDPISMLILQHQHPAEGWSPCVLETSFFLHLGYAFALIFGKADMAKFMMFHDVEWFERGRHL